MLSAGKVPRSQCVEPPNVDRVVLERWNGEQICSGERIPMPLSRTKGQTRDESQNVCMPLKDYRGMLVNRVEGARDLLHSLC